MMLAEIVRLKSVCLILLGDPLIRQDIALTLRDRDPDALLIEAVTLAEAEAAIAEMPVAVALIGGVSDLSGLKSLTAALQRAGAQIIWLGDCPAGLTVAADNDSGKAAPWSVLEFPFSTQHLTALLDQVPEMEPDRRCHR